MVKSYSEILPGVTEESYGFNPKLFSFRRETTIKLFDPQRPQTVPGSDLGIKKVEIMVFWRYPVGVIERNVKLTTLIGAR